MKGWLLRAFHFPFFRLSRPFCPPLSRDFDSWTASISTLSIILRSTFRKTLHHPRLTHGRPVTITPGSYKHASCLFSNSSFKLFMNSCNVSVQSYCCFIRTISISAPPSLPSYTPFTPSLSLILCCRSSFLLSTQL